MLTNEQTHKHHQTLQIAITPGTGNNNMSLKWGTAQCHKAPSTQSQKTVPTYFLLSLSVKYEPISIKIGRIVPEDTLNKTVPKMPTSPKVCAWEI